MINGILCSAADLRRRWPPLQCASLDRGNPPDRRPLRRPLSGTNVPDELAPDDTARAPGLLTMPLLTHVTVELPCGPECITTPLWPRSPPDIVDNRHYP